MNTISYAQFNTDLEIRKYFPDGYVGRCVEVGAAHPIKGNNTYLFETEGWDCYLIEPNTNSLPILREHRKNVFNFACGERDLEDQEFTICTLDGGEQGAISGLKVDERLLEQHLQYNPQLTTIKTQVKTLDTFLSGQDLKGVDFISIDTEGTELEVLKGLDLNRNKPRLFIIENNHEDEKFLKYLSHYGYEKTERVGVNDFYLLKENTCNYLASGRLGDLIHTLYVVKKDYEKYGTKANIFVTGHNYYLPGDGFSNSVENAVLEISPILLKQNYINSVQTWDEKDYNFTKRTKERFLVFRDETNYGPEYINLSSWRLSPLLFKRGWTEILTDWYGIPNQDLPIHPWIEIEPSLEFSDKILVFRNTIRKNERFPWPEILENNQCLFVDINEKAYNDFEFKHLVDLKVFDSLEKLFQALKGCKFYVGNLTGITAFAHCMGVPRLIELDDLGDGKLDFPHYFYERNLFRDLFCISSDDKLSDLKGIEEFISIPGKKQANKFTVVATYDHAYSEMAKITVHKNFSTYCEINGYDLYVDKMEGRDFSRDPQWHKIKLLRELLDTIKTEWIFFIDCDCLIMDQSKKLESFIENGINFIAPSNIGAPDNPRFDKFGGDCVLSSQMLIRNCDWSKEFLEEIWDSPDFKTLLDINSFDHEMRQIRVSIDKPKFKDQCRIVPNYVLNRFWYCNNPFMNRSFPAINKNAWEPGDFIVHVVGYPTQERINLLENLSNFVGGVIGEWSSQEFGVSFVPLIDLGKTRVDMSNDIGVTEITWDFSSLSKGIIYSLYLENKLPGKTFQVYDFSGKKISAYKL